MLLIQFYTLADYVCVLCGSKMQLESVWGLSASSEAATGGQVGAAVIKVRHPLPAASLVSAVTHCLNPSCTST